MTPIRFRALDAIDLPGAGHKECKRCHAWICLDCALSGYCPDCYRIMEEVRP